MKQFSENGCYCYLTDRQLDVRLNPLRNEYCSFKPCVAYGLPSVCMQYNYKHLHCGSLDKCVIIEL